MKLEKVYKVICFILATLTIIVAIYSAIAKINPGFAVILMLFTITMLALYKNKKQSNENIKDSVKKTKN